MRARACAGTQYAIDVCFLVDIVLQFRTTLLGRPEEGSIVITDTKLISRRYTRWPALHRGRFAYDLAASLPIDLLGAAAAGGVLGYTGSWLRVNRLLHALRIVSVHGSQIQKLPRPRKILVYGILWFFFAHLSACGFWAIGARPPRAAAAAPRSPLQTPWRPLLRPAQPGDCPEARVACARPSPLPPPARARPTPRWR